MNSIAARGLSTEAVQDQLRMVEAKLALQDSRLFLGVACSAIGGALAGYAITHSFVDSMIVVVFCALAAGLVVFVMGMIFSALLFSAFGGPEPADIVRQKYPDLPETESEKARRIHHRDLEAERIKRERFKKETHEELRQRYKHEAEAFKLEAAAKQKRYELFVSQYRTVSCPQGPPPKISVGRSTTSRLLSMPRICTHCGASSSRLGMKKMEHRDWELRHGIQTTGYAVLEVPFCEPHCAVPWPATTEFERLEPKLKGGALMYVHPSFAEAFVQLNPEASQWPSENSGGFRIHVS